ncbi:hypothetical protein QEN19_002556 [Hanseniaspora menglaensis]
MPKENVLFQLDTKEFQFHKLNYTLRYFNPRFHTTKLIKNANRNSKNQQKNNKKLKTINLEDLFQEIGDLKKDILFKKLYRICSKFNTKISNNSTYNDELKTTLRQLVLNRLLKSLKKKFKKYESEYKVDLTDMDENALENPFKNWQDWISEADIIANLEKDLEVSKLADNNEVNKEINKVISKLYQDKALKLYMSEFDDGMDVFLNINRGMKKVEKKNAEQASSNNNETEYNSNYDDDYSRPSNDEEYSQYENMVGNSSDDEEVQRNENYETESSNYTQNLPELEHGFIDNYASDSEDEREMEKELKKEKQVKKNRRGQRERRLIWEKKYGKTANHIQKKIIDETANKLERQQKYEDRVAKRLEKEQEYLDRMHARKQREKEYASKDFHPSWEAKRLQEEKLKKIKFSGKKIAFD